MDRAEVGPKARGAVRPGLALCVVAAMAVALGLLALGQSPTSPAHRAGPLAAPDPARAPTDAEARARFVKLDRLRLRIYEDLDPTLISVVFTPDGPLAETVAAEIVRLTRDRVESLTRFATRAVDVVSTTSDEITVLQKVVVHPRFRDAAGVDITVGSATKQWIEWTMRRVGFEWLLHDGTVVKAKVVEPEDVPA